MGRGLRIQWGFTIQSFFLVQGNSGLTLSGLDSRRNERNKSASGTETILVEKRILLDGVSATETISLVDEGRCMWGTVELPFKGGQVLQINLRVQRLPYSGDALPNLQSFKNELLAILSSWKWIDAADEGR